MSGRRALVTGGSRGIGRACVEELAGAGLEVVAVGRDGVALDEVVAAAPAGGGRVTAERCDITDEAAVAALFERVGPVDVLVNNAGTSSAAPLHRTTLEDVQRSFDVNAVGAFLCTRAAVPGMRERGWGRVVFVASVSSVVGLPYTAAYTASKHAAVGFMRTLAAELAGREITANAVCPTYVRSEMTEASVATIVGATGRDPDEARAVLEQASPLGRLLEPAEVAHAVAFLASERAGAVNGQALVLDGGGLQH